MSESQTVQTRAAVPDIRGARIGYVPYSGNLLAPGDRRRFCYYMAQRGLPFEIARPAERYDLLVVTPGGDLTTWSNYAGTARLIYEQIDGYLAETRGSPRAWLRGAAKFVSGQHRRFVLDYTALLRKMCGRADVVVCASEEQRAHLTGRCRNVEVIPDCHEGTLRRTKTDFNCGDTFHLAWEGLPYTLHFLRELIPVFRDIGARRKIALHVVTDLHYGLYRNGRWGKREATRETRGLGIPVYHYSWQEQTCASILTAADLAIIPVPMHEPLASAKPENKLILLWRLGLPVVASATPSYVRVMHAAGLHDACRDQADWLRSLERLMCDDGQRRAAARAGFDFAERHYSKQALLARWDSALATAMA